MDKMCFADLIKQGQIRIPQIQRDYAQGRLHKDVTEIRNHFVRSLLLVVTGKKAKAQLDFVYGSNRKDAFEPLDGQQRLTTLFLLHWVLGVDLQTDDGESVLTYETRNTSAAFCKELVRHRAQQFVDEAVEKTNEAKKEAQERHHPDAERMASQRVKTRYTPSEIIQNRDWFQWGWRFDPTINAMLVMIDALCEQMDWTLDIETCRSRLNNITFHHLDLGEMGLSDELFIKMNARGKLLSDFDKLKSTLEEEIQFQQGEVNREGKPLADSSIEHDWRTNMDGKWIDFFWQRYASAVMVEVPSKDNKQERLAAAEKTEKRFKTFLLRMMAMQLFSRLADTVIHQPDGIDEDALRFLEIRKQRHEALLDASYKVNDALLIAYQDQLIDWRSSGNTERPSYALTINFKALIRDINRWIIDDGHGQYRDASTLLPQAAFFDNDHRTYFSYLVDEKISNDVLVTLYSLQCFLKHYPYQPDSDAWRFNFEEWARLSRNVFKFENNNYGLNNRQDVADAFCAVAQLAKAMQTYLAQAGLDLYHHPAAVLMFVRQLNADFKGMDKKALHEEKVKAELRLIDDDGAINAAWTEAIRTAEKDPYLWGQIRCLLEWAHGDLDTFIAYSKGLTKWTSLYKEEHKQELYYNAILCLAPDCWKSKNRLYEFNKDRDNSMKRYLRDDGESVRAFIKTWNDWDAQATFEDFARHVIDSTHNTGWVKYFKQRPQMIWESRRKKIFEDKGHVIFAELKTTDSHCFDPLLKYLALRVEDAFYDREEKTWMKDVTVEFHDSKSPFSHGLVIRIPKHQCEIRWGEGDGDYAIEKDGTSTVIADIDLLVSTMEKTIAQYKSAYGH